MNVIRVVSRSFFTNTYLVYKEQTCVVIDPSGDANHLMHLATENGRSIVAILLTHGHFDHIDALEALCKFSGAPVYISAEDLSMLEDPYLNASDFACLTPICAKVNDVKIVSDRQRLDFGELSFEVYATPGHTRGSVCYLSEDVLFSGDTVFADCYGRDDLPNSAPERYAASLAHIDSLVKTKDLYSGHGCIKNKE